MSLLCDSPICDTSLAAPPVVLPPVPSPSCGLPVNGSFTNATIHTDGNGCIALIESGVPFVYTPDPCCPSGSGTGGGGAGLDGPPGADGAAATVTVGTVSTAGSGTPAAVVNVGTSHAAIFNFTIPAGAAGTDGASPTGLSGTFQGLQILNGQVQSLPSWWPPLTSFDPATVTNNGISAAFNKNPDGSVTVTLDASGMKADYDAKINVASSNTSAVNTSLNLLQGQHDTLRLDHNALQLLHNTLRTDHDALKARVDAAGIP